MSTAAQLLRSIADLVDAGAVPPEIHFGKYRTSLYFRRAGFIDGAWLPYVEHFAAEPSYVAFVRGGGDVKPFTDREWSATLDGQRIVIEMLQDGDTRTDAEILTAAAEHIRHHGLAQHDYADEAGACCVNGAIQYVVSGDATNVEAGQSAKRLFAEALGLFDAQDTDGVTVEDLIGRWNDEDGRTADQVVLALLAVGDQERTAYGAFAAALLAKT